MSDSAFERRETDPVSASSSSGARRSNSARWSSPEARLRPHGNLNPPRSLRGADPPPQ